LFLSLFFGSLALTIPVLFLTVGVPGINAFSNQVLCRLSSPKESNAEANSNPEASPGSSSPTASPPSASATSAPTSASSPSPTPAAMPEPEEANQLEACLASDPSSANPLESILNLLLILAGFGGSATGALALLLKLGEIVGDPKNDLKQYLEHPDYESQVAFIEQFHEDFEKIVTAYAGKGNKVYVFIDDLDRCELTKAADLMQGLNLLISDDPHLIFILGMDREKVAAGIALKQKDVLPYLPSSSVVLDTATQDSRVSLKGLEYGYAFIEKFIQLPFQVPQPSEKNFEYFLAELSSKKSKQDSKAKQNKVASLYFREIWRGIKAVFLNNELPTPKISSNPTGTSENPVIDNGTASSVADLPDRREAIKVSVTEDSETVRQIVLMVAPALDHNPRRIKQFINLFRLKVFIASNTGLFDEVKLKEMDQALPPLTMEQLGKFTALCMKYPLLRVDLAKDDKLLANLQRYALRDVYSPTDKYAFMNGSNRQNGASSFGDMTKYWGSEPKLVQLLRVGCDGTNKLHKPEGYSLEKVDVKQLLQISPRVHPLDRIPLRSEKGVDYRRLRSYLRSGQWREADQETDRVMLQAAGQTKQEYLGTDDIRKFPCQDLQTIDQLWVAASKGRFGFSVQKRIWQECGSPLGYDDDWKKFCARVGWRKAGDWLYYNQLTFNPEKSLTGELPAHGKRVGRICGVDKGGEP